ncbi:hypothetical protein KIN20_026107 [Parelaphostrongylus tenuis]|uniref:Uncharacterized protein n=1 Tax=Parelaphostrongylus tenuis TaxID=148309 RepID=A0AAD5QXG8_PARTN|nr:hypothetical protein KIN20_026107 [Parelaphostrongylus tenuis]
MTASRGPPPSPTPQTTHSDRCKCGRNIQGEDSIADDEKTWILKLKRADVISLRQILLTKREAIYTRRWNRTGAIE